MLCDTQLGNYAVKIINMTLGAWIYEIHQFHLKSVIIINEVKIIAITYFLATLAILGTKIAIARYLVAKLPSIDLKLVALDLH